MLFKLLEVSSGVASTEAPVFPYGSGLHHSSAPPLELPDPPRHTFDVSTFSWEALSNLPDAPGLP